MNFKFISWYLAMSFVSVSSSIVLTTTGPVLGLLVYDEIYYHSYQGIPYAENPTGSQRFMPPVPKRPWTNILDATKEGPVCPQAEGTYKKKQMSEDCLRLNIYVPVSQQSLPVLVYVHGGEFKSLSGNSDYQYGPQLIMQRDVIFVTMNYRLGALGFLSLDTQEAAGNAGIKDVLQALTWIKANINRFGGDPNRITLGGNSAGAVLAHYLTLTIKSTGLFQQALLISGSALGYRFLARHAKDNALTLAKQLGLEGCSDAVLIQNLKNIDAFDIVQAQENMGKGDSRNGFRPYAPFVPCVEIESPSAIITQDPLDILKSGIPQNVPILAGFNAQEGIKMIPVIQKDLKLVNNLNDNFELCIPSDIEYPYGSWESTELAKSIRQFYFDGGVISNSTLPYFVDLIRDTQFSYSVDSWIKLHKERKDSKALYYYILNFDGELNWFKIVNNINFPGTAHADELGYIFVTKATKTKLNTINSRTHRMLDIMTRLLTNFVKFGIPTPEAGDNTDVKWPECGRERNHLYLNDYPVIRNGPPIPDNLDFWYEIYDRYYYYLMNGGLMENKVVP